MTAFATPEDLATFVQHDLDEADTATAELLLDIVSAAIRNYTGQTITAVTDDIVTLDALGKRVLFLPEVPVTAVASVIADGVTVPSTDYHWYRDGRLYRKNYWWWGIDRQSVVVTYSHGYATVPDEVRLVTLDLCRRMMHGFTSLTGLGETPQLTENLLLAELTETHRQVLNQFRPVVLA